MKLPRLFTDGLVVQQGMPIPVWGWSKPLQQVQVHLGGKLAETQADAKGMWMVKLPKLWAKDHPKPLSMLIQADETLSINDVLVGEVWLCAGDSAMHQTLAQCGAVEEASHQALHPLLRLFRVAPAGAPRPQDDVQTTASWGTCTLERSAHFSAVSYYFGCALARAQQVPVGLILAAHEGALGEAWTSRAALSSETALGAILRRCEMTGTLPAPDSADFKRQLKTWQDKAYHRDPGNKGARRGWNKTSCKDTTWKPLTQPGAWQEQGLTNNGAVWLRKHVDLPKEWRGKALILSLGKVADFDTTYVNGTQVGHTTTASAEPRVYEIPGKLVKAGGNLIAVRIFNRHGDGGMVGSPAQLSLALRDAPKAKRSRPVIGRTKVSAKPTKKPVAVVPSRIPLSGPWLSQVELPLAAPSRLGTEPLHNAHPDVPSALCNAMIQPLVPYGLRGAIWYHGTRNLERAEQYRTLLATLIKDWRIAWGQGDFPFGIVQLSGRSNPGAPAKHGESAWAELREAQSAASSTPHVGVAVSYDLVGTQSGPSEREIGNRLSQWVRSEIHQDKVAWSGPCYESMHTEGGSIHLRFTHADGGLSSASAGALSGFTIAGSDRRFVAAEAVITADGITVRSNQVRTPVAVRYGWSDQPTGTLRNGAGLPAAPFRTDTWELSTHGQR